MTTPAPTTPDYSVLRTNMVESQVRTNDVTDRRIIRAMLALPRELFVPDAQRSMAYRDEPITLAQTPGQGKRELLPPMLMARLIHLASIEPEHTVLEIGSATGYGAALMARLAKRVVALESDPQLAAKARVTLAALAIGNVDVVEGPLPQGWPAAAPYDRIVLSGSVAALPDALLAQTRATGRLIGVLGDGWLGRTTILEKVGAAWSQTLAFTIGAPALPGFAKSAEFAL